MLNNISHRAQYIASKLLNIAILTTFLCASHIAHAQSWITGYSTLSPNFSRTLPALNTPYVDDAFGMTVTRISDPSVVTGNPGSALSYVRHEYSRRPAFNSNGTRLLQLYSNSYYGLYGVNSTANTVSFTKSLPTSITEYTEPNWHPTDPDQLRYFGTGAQAFRIMQHNVSTNVTAELRNLNLNNRITNLFPAAASVSTGSEGRPSNNGNIWCLLVNNSAGSKIGVMAYKLDTDSILGSMNIVGMGTVDHVSTSPLGNRCVVSWAEGGYGTRSYSTNFSSYALLDSYTAHYDLGLLNSTTEVMVIISYSSGYEGVNLVNLQTGARTKLLDIYLSPGTTTAGHVSMVGSEQTPGWALISTYSCSTSYGSTACTHGAQWYKDKVFLLRLTPSVEIINLAHTRNADAPSVWAPPGGADKPYFLEPQAVSNRNYSKIVFATGWGAATNSAVRSYMINVPVANLPGGTPTFSITASSATRTGDYTADLAVTTSTPAQCRMSLTAPTTFAQLYDNFSTTNNLNHTKSGISLASTGAETRYAVCKANSSTAEATATILVPGWNTPPPPQPGFSVNVTSVTRTGAYAADVIVSTNYAATCALSLQPGQAYSSLYDYFVAASGGAQHTKSGISLPGSGQHIRYAVCKRTSNGEEKEATVTIN